MREEDQRKGRGWNILPHYFSHPHAGDAAFIYIFLVIYMSFGFFLFGLSIYQLTSGETDKADNYRVLIIAAGTMLAAPFAIWRLFTSNTQANAAREQARIAQENHFTELFVRAIGQLGATREIDGKQVPAVEIRIGAIHSLKRIALESEKDRDAILNILVEYIQINSPWKYGDLAPEPATPDVNQALRAIGVIPHSKYLSIKNTNLKFTDFCFLNFSNVFQDCFFSGLINNLQVTGGQFFDSHFENVTFFGCFFDANTSSRSIENNFLRCRFEASEFKTSEFKFVHFINCAFLNNNHLKKSKLDNCSFERSEVTSGA